MTSKTFMWKCVTILMTLVMCNCAGYLVGASPREAMRRAGDKAIENCGEGSMVLVETYPVLWFYIGHWQCMEDNNV